MTKESLSFVIFKSISELRIDVPSCWGNKPSTPDHAMSPTVFNCWIDFSLGHSRSPELRLVFL